MKTLSAFSELPDDAMISIPTVAVLLDAGISTVWRRVKSGELPKTFKFGGSTRMRVGDIRAVLRGQVTK